LLQKKHTDDMSAHWLRRMTVYSLASIIEEK